jgi:hypothetical protein
LYYLLVDALVRWRVVLLTQQQRISRQQLAQLRQPWDRRWVGWWGRERAAAG